MQQQQQMMQPGQPMMQEPMAAPAETEPKADKGPTEFNVTANEFVPRGRFQKTEEQFPSLDDGLQKSAPAMMK